MDQQWQDKTLFYFDAFLAGTLSIPDVITHVFGWDEKAPSDVKDIIDAHLPADKRASERQHRNLFSKKFEVPIANFKKRPLSTARHVTLHRAGVAPVQFAVISSGGVIEAEGLDKLPLFEPPFIVTNSDDPAQLFAATQPSQSTRPCVAEFKIGNEPLFDASRAHLTAATALTESAKELARCIYASA